MEDHDENAINDGKEANENDDAQDQQQLARSGATAIDDSN
jgi:hypothetical protein